jgi:heterogeneous nuclear rnp K-like protein 2
MPAIRVRIISPIASIFLSVAHLPSASPQGSRSPSPTGRDVLTLRALVSTRDAGVIIGKGGKNVADLREQTGVKAGVTKVVPGVHERVLSISGSVESVAKVCLRCRFRA